MSEVNFRKVMNWGGALVAGIAAVALVCANPGRAEQAPLVLRIGYFPNVTHAQALVGRAQGQFEKAVGPGAKIEWKAFNAGPAAVEALFAGAIDVAYLGPNPTVAGYVRSGGEAVRLIAGAASGGASLVVREGSGIKKPEDFRGKKVATPQQGNSQDVALRAWLEANGLKSWDRGGDVQVLPISNGDQLALFRKGQIDAAWAPEPWAARLVDEAGGRILLDQRDQWPNRKFASTDVVVRPKFLAEHRDIVRSFLRAHVELTNWIGQNPVQAKQIINRELQKQTGYALSPQELNDAFSRMEVTCDPLRSSIEESSEQAFQDGFLGRRKPDLSGLYDLSALREILGEKEARRLQ